jgi:hydroxyacylglutathione hydrolase
MSADISPDDLISRIDAGRPPFILDVRSRAEFDAGHVPGSVNVPFWLVPFRASSLPARQDELVVVYCGHGPRAQIATAALRAKGFTNIACLAGHWSGWRAAGRREAT